MALPEQILDARALLAEFTRGLAELGWSEGANLQTEVRWAGSDLNLVRKFARS